MCSFLVIIVIYVVVLEGLWESRAQRGTRGSGKMLLFRGFVLLFCVIFLVVFVVDVVVLVPVGLWESRAQRGTTRTEEW